MRMGFRSIALAILIQQDLDYILLKTDIHSFVSKTETFLSDIFGRRDIDIQSLNSKTSRAHF